MSTTAPTTEARLHLDPQLTGRGMLDGGWWPRSTDPATELPAVIDALGDARGTVTHILLSPGDWDLPHPRRLTTHGRMVRLGWFTSQPTGLITLICNFSHDRFDLLVIPPKWASGPAAAAMRAASDTGNTQHVPDLLARVGR